MVQLEDISIQEYVQLHTLVSYSLEDCNVKEYQKVLLQDGFLIIELQYPDRDAIFLQQMIEKLGIMNPHNDDLSSFLWDVTCSGDNNTSKSQNSIEKARSQTSNEFNLHTDCSFEDPPPRFMGLYVVEEDCFGGGYSLILHIDSLLSRLSEETISTLKNTKFRFKVPKEFFKGVQYIEAPIIQPNGTFRYRDECVDISEHTNQQQTALQELEALLRDPSLRKSFFMKKGTIWILDNGKFFHGRTEILDKRRHLKRIRFNLNP